MAEAGFAVEKLRTYPGGWPREDLLVLEDFAKLIIKECSDIVADAVDHREPASTYVDKINQHFGIEELPVCKHNWYSAKNSVVQNGSVCVICRAIDPREPEELKNDRQ